MRITAMELTGRFPGAREALQAADRLGRGGFAGRPPVGAWYTHGRLAHECPVRWPA
jgi:hypothetical protein